jgi:cytochrome b subunit of formate dehydrogenase/ribosomal protein S27AE
VFVLLLGASGLVFAKGGKGIGNEQCLACHNDPSLTKDVGGKPVSLYVSEEKFKASLHGSLLSCVDCHQDVKSAPHENPPARVSCARCHAAEQAQYENSFHAKAIQAGDSRAATCTDCHGSPHELLAAGDPKSRVSHQNIPQTCGACHGQKFVMAESGHSNQPFLSYQNSVHGRAVAAGNLKAAVCTDCHGVHEILGAGNPKSPIFKFNVPQTCATCHESIKREFMGSIHGQAIARGNWQAPVCTDCHGIHAIQASKDPASSVSGVQLAKNTCARCHEGMRLTQEFGIAGRRATTYLASYHGLASEGGSSVAANCASCHGVHNILPSSDPRSMIYPANLVKTCGQCHPGATENFTKGKIHLDVPLSADIGSKTVRWVRRFYLLIIAVTIGGMILHNLIVWRRKAIEARRRHPRIVVRMDASQRYQHLVLLVSFFVLVLTGFALKYPDSWLAAALLMHERLRGILHRVAGVTLILVSLYHLGYLIVHPGGRKLLWDMLPGPRDAWDVIHTLRYNLGLTDQKPYYPRFSYGEKFEYLALVWGVLVMALTGLGLWFKVQVGHFAPRWILDVFTAVHFYEAVLATLAILIWHFYQVIFDPDVYPMNWSWYDGRVSIEHYVEEHGADTETIAGAIDGAAEANSGPPAAETGGEPGEGDAPQEGSDPGGKHL